MAKFKKQFRCDIWYGIHLYNWINSRYVWITIPYRKCLEYIIYFVRLPVMFNNHKTINCAIPHRTYSETTNPSCINSKIMFGFKYCSRSLRAHFSYYALYSFFVRFIHHKRKTKYQSIHINNRCAFGGLQNHAIIKNFKSTKGNRIDLNSHLFYT